MRNVQPHSAGAGGARVLPGSAELGGTFLVVALRAAARNICMSEFTSATMTTLLLSASLLPWPPRRCSALPCSRRSR